MERLTTHSQSRDIEKEIAKTFQSRKRLFIGLLCGTSLALVLLLVILWIIPYVGLTNIHAYAPWILGIIILVAIFLVLWTTTALLLNIIFKKPILFSKNLRGIAIKIYLPLMTVVGNMIGLSKEKVRASFIRVNNEMIRAEGRNYKQGEILLLLPHCLQNSLCKYRLTYDIYNCRRCGECPISDLISLSEKYSIHIAIATGGTIARRIVVQTKPKLILAVACERDLSSGIQDTYPLPVYGVLNERPYGPCLDTTLSLKHVEWALTYFLEDSEWKYNQEEIGNWQN